MCIHVYIYIYRERERDVCPLQAAAGQELLRMAVHHLGDRFSTIAVDVSS